MDSLTSISAMRQWSAARRAESRTIGFVPTMGALHEGHLELVRASVRDCGATVASVFVNPTQFGPGEDLDRYPRDLERDRRMLAGAKCSALFTISAGEMYPPGFETWVDLDNLPRHLCGASRPGHFRGVATVLAKLFHIVAPDKAYFGWKDAQQALIIKKMVRDLNFGIEIETVPIVRDADGLALSSRNAYLSGQERTRARLVPQAIEMAREFYRAGGSHGNELLNAIKAHFASAGGVEVDYVSLVRMEDLQPTDRLAPGAMLALAVRVGATRLIDNCRFTEDRTCSDS